MRRPPFVLRATALDSRDFRSRSLRPADGEDLNLRSTLPRGSLGCGSSLNPCLGVTDESVCNNPVRRFNGYRWASMHHHRARAPLSAAHFGTAVAKIAHVCPV